MLNRRHGPTVAAQYRSEYTCGGTGNELAYRYGAYCTTDGATMGVLDNRNAHVTR